MTSFTGSTFSRLPSLRERKEDIPVLVEYFIDRYASKAGKSIRGVYMTFSSVGSWGCAPERLRCAPRATVLISSEKHRKLS